MLVCFTVLVAATIVHETFADPRNQEVVQADDKGVAEQYWGYPYRRYGGYGYRGHGHGSKNWRGRRAVEEVSAEDRQQDDQQTEEYRHGAYRGRHYGQHRGRRSIDEIDIQDQDSTEQVWGYPYRRHGGLGYGRRIYWRGRRSLDLNQSEDQKADQVTNEQRHKYDGYHSPYSSYGYRGYHCSYRFHG